MLLKIGFGVEFFFIVYTLAWWLSADCVRPRIVDNTSTELSQN